MLLKYGLSISKLSFVILTIAYFLGVFWYVISKELYHYQLEENAELDPAKYNTETFVGVNDLDPETSQRTDAHNMVLLMYFAYTTLSTVGFGDFNPRSDIERALCIIILLLGVGIFGKVMADFLEIIERFQKLDEELEDGDNLSKFFGALKERYNYGVDVDLDRKRKIEQYFAFRWQNDK